MPLEDFTLPLCIIPDDLFRNIEEKARKLKNEDEEAVRRYAEAICSQYDVPLKNLIFQNGLLKNISFPSSGLDYDYGRYVFHNTSPDSDAGRAAFSIAARYLALVYRL